MDIERPPDVASPIHSTTKVLQTFDDELTTTTRPLADPSGPPDDPPDEPATDSVDTTEHNRRPTPQPLTDHPTTAARPTTNRRPPKMEIEKSIDLW